MKKRALLFIHGFPLDRTIWEHQIAGLERRATVVAPDLPGFGGSDPGPRPWTMERYALDLLKLLDELGLRRFTPVGHSMGGYILFALDRLAPDRLEGAVLVSSRSTADVVPEARARREDLIRLVGEKGTAALEDAMLPRVFAPDAPAPAIEKARAAVRRASVPGVVAALRGMMARPDSTPQLASWTTPALVIAGAKDALVPAAESEAMAKAIPKGRLVWAARSGHMPMLEEPELVTSAIGDFLDALP